MHYTSCTIRAGISYIFFGPLNVTKVKNTVRCIRNCIHSSKWQKSCMILHHIHIVVSSLNCRLQHIDTCPTIKISEHPFLISASFPPGELFHSLISLWSPLGLPWLQQAPLLQTSINLCSEQICWSHDVSPVSYTRNKALTQKASTASVTEVTWSTLWLVTSWLPYQLVQILSINSRISLKRENFMMILNH